MLPNALIEPESTQEKRHADQLMIHLADFDTGENVLGPGKRALIWVQGCPRRCHQCITPHMQSFTVEREWVTPTALAARVLAHMPLEGVTFVGGEPFSHARQLAALVHELRRTTNLSVVTYTGHTYERILALRRSDWQDLLACTDILIDGEYIVDRHCDLLWRGSDNQRLHFLSSRYQLLAPILENAHGRLLEFKLDARGNLRVIGIPEPNFFKQLSERLKVHDVELTLQ